MIMKDIKYLGNMEDLETVEAPLWYHTRGLMQTATGYGRDLRDSRKVKHNGRWYRIYYTCFSNCASLYIKTKGECLYIR